MRMGKVAQYHGGKCSKCGGENDGTRCYCKRCDAGYRRERRKARTEELHRLREALARISEQSAGDREQEKAPEDRSGVRS